MKARHECHTRLTARDFIFTDYAGDGRTAIRAGIRRESRQSSQKLLLIVRRSSAARSAYSARRLATATSAPEIRLQ
jgi:hypothetical protein